MNIPLFDKHPWKERVRKSQWRLATGGESSHPAHWPICEFLKESIQGNWPLSTTSKHIFWFLPSCPPQLTCVLWMSLLFLNDFYAFWWTCSGTTASMNEDRRQGRKTTVTKTWLPSIFSCSLSYLYDRAENTKLYPGVSASFARHDQNQKYNWVREAWQKAGHWEHRFWKTTRGWANRISSAQIGKNGG